MTKDAIVITLMVGVFLFFVASADGYAAGIRNAAKTCEGYAISKVTLRDRTICVYDARSGYGKVALEVEQ